MRKESVQKFDLEAAFKALNEVEIPVVKGIRPNREDLQEKFTRKLVTDILVEDYYDVGDSGELEQAQEEREAEIAKAKLARIEKIVDLDAETEEDLLPSYVGKFIMQCPQCMTLFYKNEEDIEKSEENPGVVNLNEPCQHCGNSSGYTLVGKVDTVGEEEASQYDAEDFSENELDLDFEEEPAEETPEEETEETTEDAATEEGNEEELDLVPVEDEETSEESEEEEVEESLTKKPLREDWEADVAKADKILRDIITQSDNNDYDEGDGYWKREYDQWCNRYLYYSDILNNFAQVEKLCAEYSTEHCQFYAFEDDAEEDPISEIGYVISEDEISLEENFDKKDLKEATIHMKKADMERLDKEVEEAGKEVAKYNIPMKAQKNSAGQTENVPDFEAVPEAQREAAKKAYERYQKALKARPSRSQYNIIYDESLAENFKGHVDNIEELKAELLKKIPESDLWDTLGKKDELHATIPGTNINKIKSIVESVIADSVLDAKVMVEKATMAEGDWISVAITGIKQDYGKMQAYESLNTADHNTLNEAIEDNLDSKLKEHEEYIDYLRKAITDEEATLKKATNEQVKKAIQKRIDAFREDLEAALPEAVKAEANAEELPTPEETDMENAAENKEESKDKKESLTESLRTWTCVFDGQEIGTVEAETADEAYSKMEATWPELHYGMYDGVAEVMPAEEVDEALVNLNLDARGQSVGIAGGTGGAIDTITNESADKLDEFVGPAVASIAGAAVANNLVNKAFEGLDEAAPVSTLKRKLSTTEVIVKELKTHPLFSRLSTRTIQRILLPYYIENMGREDMSAEAIIEFFEFEGFAPYVLDHFMTMDPLARKELLKADARFMKIFNAYAKEYKLFPGNSDELENGMSEFDYIFEIIFDMNSDGTVQDTIPNREAIQTFGKMYATGKFDRALVVAEALTEAAEDSLDVLLDSDEFKKHISEKEVENIKAKYEGLEEEVAPGAESVMMMRDIVDTWESVEDLDDETFNKLTENYLTEVYSNVKSFEATSCDLRDNKLVVEGTITFNSGKTKPTTFVYEAKETADKTIILEGVNADFTNEKAFTLSCKVDTENCLIVESLNYKYIINDTLVEGLLK